VTIVGTPRDLMESSLVKVNLPRCSVGV